MNLCNIPQDILARQAMIDTIPDMSLLVLIGLIVAVVIKTYTTWIKYVDSKELVILIGGGGVGLVGLWVWAGHLLTRIVTCLANPEYAAMLKFTTACTK